MIAKKALFWKITEHWAICPFCETSSNDGWYVRNNKWELIDMCWFFENKKDAFKYLTEKVDWKNVCRVCGEELDYN